MVVGCFPFRYFARMDEPIIDLHSDAHFMGEALRQAALACKAAQVPVVHCFTTLTVPVPVSYSSFVPNGVLGMARR